MDLDSVVLKYGSHKSPEDGMCAMEAASWLAGEHFTDHPVCVCPVIGAFVRNLNDNIKDDETRTALLRPLLPRLLNTVGSRKLELKRAFMCADAAVRVFAPLALEAAGLSDRAKALRELPEIVDETTAAADAAYATAAAYADAAAAYAASAAYATAYAAAYAAAAAAAAAYAAASAAASKPLLAYEQAAVLIVRLCEAKES